MRLSASLRQHGRSKTSTSASTLFDAIHIWNNMIKVILIDGKAREIREVEIPQSYHAIQDLLGGDAFWVATNLSSEYGRDIVFHPEAHNVGYADFKIGWLPVQGKAVLARVGLHSIPEGASISLDQARCMVVWIEHTKKTVNPDEEWHWPTSGL